MFETWISSWKHPINYRIIYKFKAFLLIRISYGRCFREIKKIIVESKFFGFFRFGIFQPQENNFLWVFGEMVLSYMVGVCINWYHLDSAFAGSNKFESKFTLYPSIPVFTVYPTAGVNKLFFKYFRLCGPGGKI